MRLGRRLAMLLASAALIGPWPRAAWAQLDLTPRWQPGDPPPDVEGVRLGDTRAQVVSALGQPEDWPGAHVDDTVREIMRYRHGALMIVVGKPDAVLRITLRRPEGGALAGVRVGDRLGTMLRSWGEPTQSRGKTGLYQEGDWAIVVQADLAEQKVLGLKLARSLGGQQPTLYPEAPGLGGPTPAPPPAAPSPAAPPPAAPPPAATQP